VGTFSQDLENAGNEKRPESRSNDVRRAPEEWLADRSKGHNRSGKEGDTTCVRSSGYRAQLPKDPRAATAGKNKTKLGDLDRGI